MVVYHGGVSKNVLRREFLTSAVGACGSTLFVPACLNAVSDVDDPRVAQIISRTIAIDMHNHVYPQGTEPAPQAPQEAQRELQGAQPFLAEELKRSGLTAVCASYVLDFASNGQPGDARDKLLRWFTAVDTQLAFGHIHRALNLKDLQAAHESKNPTIVQAVEGAMFIEGHLDRVDEVYRRGLRHLQLLHERDDAVSPLGDVNTVPTHLGGLTPFGADVIKECNRVGILIDLAHASHETVLGALKVTTQPVVISHTNLDSWASKNSKMAEVMKPRLISKEHAKVVADAGGVIGVWTHLADSLEDFVKSIRAMIDAVGVEHVGIGTDTDLLSSRAGQGTNVAYPDLSGGFFPAVIGEMLRQGLAPADIGRVGGENYCRVFEKATMGHS